MIGDKLYSLNSNKWFNSVLKKVNQKQLNLLILNFF